ncbi:Casein kinase I isoform alpha [Nymphon striatum]|nr:Casein kinase I isoform alpha [Nymphon striatum]
MPTRYRNGGMQRGEARDDVSENTMNYFVFSSPLVAMQVKRNTLKGDELVGGSYRLLQKIGSGSFGDIYRGVNIKNEERVAVKVEPLNASHPQLFFEYRVYAFLRDKQGIAKTRWFGEEYGNKILVMDLLGSSLEELFNYCSRRFTLKTVLLLANSMISLVEEIHKHHFLHRDIKPDNFLMGLGDNCKTYNKHYRQQLQLPYSCNPKHLNESNETESAEDVITKVKDMGILIENIKEKMTIL